MIYTAISLELATKLCQLACEKARECKITICVSIFDNHANLKCFYRMDNTACGSIQVSQLKAKTSGLFKVSSQELAKRSVALPPDPYVSIPDILPLPGGVPILNSKGVHIGAIGISGGTPELDVRCAQSAIEAIEGLSF